MTGDHFTTHHEAAVEARRRANASGLDVCIEKASRYTSHGFVVRYASHNDSDYARCEIVRPDARLSPRNRENP